MAPSTLVGLFFGFLSVFDAVTATNEYIYEFGTKRPGSEVYQRDGYIGLLSLFTEVQIYVPRNIRISYVRVIVYSISSPKVDFDEQTNTVSIKYSWTQITLSEYKIFAKGVPAT